VIRVRVQYAAEGLFLLLNAHDIQILEESRALLSVSYSSTTPASGTDHNSCERLSRHAASCVFDFKRLLLARAV